MAGGGKDEKGPSEQGWLSSAKAWLAGLPDQLGNLKGEDFRKPIVLVGVVALVVGLGGGYLLGRAGDGQVIDTGGRGIAQAEGARGFTWPFFGRPRSANAPRPGAERPEGFAVWRQRVDTAGDAPRACIEMSRELDPQVAYADYVLISPDPGGAPAVSAEGAELCIGGLGFTDSEITLLKGFPSRGGDELAANTDVDFVFGDQPPFVGFAGDGVILPREESDGVGIVTINVEKLEVEVWRVADRNLVRKDIAVTEPVGEGDYLGSWGADYPADEGERIWIGEVEVSGERDTRTTTVFPLGAVLREMRPGGYILVVRDATGDTTAGQDDEDDYYGGVDAATARRWVIFTDMALMSYSGADGLDAVVRSLSSAKSLAAIDVSLVASNGEILAEATSDAGGRVRFAQALLDGREGMSPSMLMAYGPQGDLAVLDLHRAPMDLSRQGVGGRTDSNLTGGRSADTAIDSYVYPDRGIYRPGETAHLVALVRDREAKAVSDRRGALVVYRPSGVEFERYPFERAQGGHVAQDVTLPRSAPRGRWRAAVEIEGIDQAVGEVAFSVEDFVPQRLAVDVNAREDDPVLAGETRTVEVDARFLYGAPGAGLQTQIEARLSEDVNPFPDYRDYAFGDDQDPYQERFIEASTSVTDGAGRAMLGLSADEAEDTATPLRALVTASVFEPGGRPVRESAFVRIRPKPVYLGVKIDETETRNRDNPVNFEIIALNGDGDRIAAQDVEWTLITENWDYDWYQQNGRWQWRRTSRDVIADQGTDTISAGEALAFTRNLNWGDYRLEVTGPDGARTVVKFAAGWGAPADEGDAPDLVRVTPANDDYVQGDTIDINIAAPYGGEAQIAVATDHVIELRNVTLGENGGTVSLRSSAEWGGGAYVMVTVVQPRRPASVPVPRRAMGVTYVPLDPAGRALDVEIATPDKIDSKDEVVVPVSVSGLGVGQRARVTVAAVDEGILRLTGFDSPDPVDWYFGKRALGVDYRDDYARLLDPNLGAAANVNFGGDEIGGEGLTVVPTKSVALWSGVVQTGTNGQATITLPAADFNGEVRLMAVAWTEDAVGSAAASMTVRQAVVADLNLPRFLSPGDTAEATLELHNLEGAEGEYTAEINGRGGIVAQFRRVVALVLGQRITERVEIDAPERTGIGEVGLSVTGPDFETQKAYPLQTRLGWGQVTRTFVSEQAAGASFTPPGSMIAGLQPGSVTMHVSYSPFRGFDPAAVALALHQYQYGCSEQIVSTAYPLLYADFAPLEGSNWSAERELNEAVQQLLGRQSLDGAFGMWRVGDGDADGWLGAYITDFLLEAREKGADVPQAALDRALGAMRQISRPDGYAPVSYRLNYPSYWARTPQASREATERMRSRASAYALYVMAKGDHGDLARLRWWHDVRMRQDRSPIARAQVGAGLAMMGDNARARSAIQAAISALGYRDEQDWYQSPLRDLAAVITYAYEAGQDELARQLQSRLEGAVRDPDMLNTQEQARLLQAAGAMLADSGAPNVTATGAIDIPDVAGQPRWAVGLLPRASFTNAGEGPLWRTVTVTGTPSQSPGAVANGASASKAFFTMGGASVNPASVSQGDRIVVRINGVSRQGRTALMVIDDALPAGWEIETVLSPEDSDSGPFGFLGELSYVNVQEKRDDRYVAAVDVPGNESFSVAYIARAVTPGDFYLPGVEIEDMYRPQINARSAGSRTVIAAGP